MRKFLTIFTLSLLAVSCIDNDYDLSDIDTDDIGIGDENSVFTCPLMTLRVAVADIVNEQGDLDGILAEADVWLPNRLPDGAEAVDVKRLTGGDGQQAQQAYVQTLLTALQEEIDADASDRKLEQIARQIYAEYREDFLPDYLPVDVDEAEYIAAFRTVYHQQATHDLIWENIELFAARYLTTNLRIDVRPFVLSGIDVGADVRDMIVGGDESKTSLSLFGDIATDLPVSFSAEPSFEAEVEGSDRTLFSFPSFTVFPTAEAPVEIEETSVSADALTVIFDQETRIELNMQLENYYPGLGDIPTKQFIAMTPQMSSVVNELVFLEAETEEDAEKAAEILQKRIDDQAAGGAWYPESMEAWGRGQVIQEGTYVAMIASAEHQEEIADAFEGLFA